MKSRDLRSSTCQFRTGLIKLQPVSHQLNPALCFDPIPIAPPGPISDRLTLNPDRFASKTKELQSTWEIGGYLIQMPRALHPYP
jgi:hypothetical protein